MEVCVFLRITRFCGEFWGFLLQGRNWPPLRGWEGFERGSVGAHRCAPTAIHVEPLRGCSRQPPLARGKAKAVIWIARANALPTLASHEIIGAGSRNLDGRLPGCIPAPRGRGGGVICRNQGQGGEG